MPIIFLCNVNPEYFLISLENKAYDTYDTYLSTYDSREQQFLSFSPAKPFSHS